MYASGSVGLFILQYVIFGAIVTLGAICYIELACVVPLSGGETVYIKAALGDWCAFIYSWLRALVIGPSSCAYLAAAGAQNVLRLTPSILSFLVCSEGGINGPVCSDGADQVCPDGTSNGPGDLSKRWAETLIAIAATGLISAINMWSVKWSARLQNVLTVAKLVGMAVLIIGGLVSMVTNGMDNFQTGFDQLENLRPLSTAGIAVLAFNGGFAYDGWNQLNFITEEIKDPMKNLPRSIFIGMPLIMVIYTLTAVSYVAVLPVASYDWQGAGQNAAVC
jgi:L-type amino acid transporter 9